MLSLSELPAEIIATIAGFVGGAWIRYRVERLLLCKAWYLAAITVAYKDVAIDIEALQRFLAEAETSNRLVQTRYLFVEGKNLYKSSKSYAKLMESKMESMVGPNKDRNFVEMQLRVWWTINMCDLLKSFAEYLPQLGDLRSFRVKVPIGSLTSERLDRLRNETMVSLITQFPKTLTSLTIDTPGGPSIFKPKARKSEHICPLLLNKEILPSLRHLGIRTHNTCPSLFKVKDVKLNNQLRTLIINISMAEGGLYAAVNGRFCKEKKYIGRVLYQHMIDLSVDSANRFPTIKTLRVIHLDSRLPGYHEICYNALTHREVIFPRNIRWDDATWDDDGADVVPTVTDSYGDSLLDSYWTVRS